MIILSIANESDKMFEYHGENRYFLSRGKNKEAAKENMYKFLCEEFTFFEYEFDVINSDVEEIINILSEKDFPEIKNLKENSIIEISEELYEEIIEQSTSNFIFLKE